MTLLNNTKKWCLAIVVFPISIDSATIKQQPDDSYVAFQNSTHQRCLAKISIFHVGVALATIEQQLDSSLVVLFNNRKPKRQEKNEKRIQLLSLVQHGHD